MMYSVHISDKERILTSIHVRLETQHKFYTSTVLAKLLLSF